MRTHFCPITVRNKKRYAFLRAKYWYHFVSNVSIEDMLSSHFWFIHHVLLAFNLHFDCKKICSLKKIKANQQNYELTLSALIRMSLPAVAKIVLSILVAVPVWRLATRWAAVWDRDYSGVNKRHRRYLLLLFNEVIM